MKMMDRASILKKIKIKYHFPVSYNQFRTWVSIGLLDRPTKESKGRAGGAKGWWDKDCIEKAVLIYWLIKDGYRLKQIGWAKEVIEKLNDPNIEALLGIKVLGKLAEKVSNRKTRLLSRYLFVREALKKEISPIAEPHRVYRMKIHYHVTSEGRKSLEAELHPIKIEKEQTERIETIP